MVTASPSLAYYAVHRQATKPVILAILVPSRVDGLSFSSRYREISIQFEVIGRHRRSHIHVVLGRDTEFARHLLHWQLTFLIDNCDSTVGKMSTVPAKPGHGGCVPFVCSFFEPVGGILLMRVSLHFVKGWADLPRL